MYANDIIILLAYIPTDTLTIRKASGTKESVRPPTAQKGTPNPPACMWTYHCNQMWTYHCNHVQEKKWYNFYKLNCIQHSTNGRATCETNACCNLHQTLNGREGNNTQTHIYVIIHMNFMASTKIKNLHKNITLVIGLTGYHLGGWEGVSQILTPLGS